MLKHQQNRINVLFGVLIALFWRVTASAQEIPRASPVAQAGDSVTAEDWRAAILADWKIPPTFGAIEAGANSLALITRRQPEHIYDLQTRLLNRIPLKKGDTLYIRFAARSRVPDKTSGVAKLRISFGKATPLYDRSYQGEIGLSAKWLRYDLPFTCRNDFAPDEATMNFTFGFPAQEAEVADVHVFRYGPEVTPAALPKTKRYADPISPEQLKRDIDRIAAMRQALTSIKDPAPAHGKTLYVAITGSASGDGAPARPFATIPQALAVAQPGDTVLVGAGEYREPRGISIKRSGRLDAWIKIKAALNARPKIITSNWSGFELRGGIAYIEINGFEMEWKRDPVLATQNGVTVHGVGIAPMYATHHIRILNNVIHGYGTGGICALDCDYMYLEGNTIYDTAKTSPYGGSAISLCRAFNCDENSGYHNVVRRNVCYDNELRVSVLESSGGNGKVLTDGNGIIIDVFKRSRANPLKPHGEDRDGPLEPYRGRTLVENNLIYNNGGRGIHIFRSEKVDVVNNTCYMNQKTPDINAGELTAIESGEVTFFNNIAYGRKGKQGNSQEGSTRVLWDRNLVYNADDILLSDGILVDRDPLFRAASLDAKPEGFRLRADSPAQGSAIARVAPPDDLSGATRKTSGRVALGAFQNPGKP